MQHLQPSFSDDIVPSPPPPSQPQQQEASLSSSSSSLSSSCFSIDVEEAAETRIQRLISEHPVIIFSKSSCCMCHVMKQLFFSIRVHPTVIELDDDQELAALPDEATHPKAHLAAPAVFIGGKRIGGLESLVALHVSGHLVPMLVEVGALWGTSSSSTTTTSTMN